MISVKPASNASSTSFGMYLLSLRSKYGDRTSTAFLNRIFGDKARPFTDNFYRDVEAGRRHMSIDYATALVDAMQLGGINVSIKDSFQSDVSQQRAEYFWHYFRDSLSLEDHKLLFGIHPGAGDNNPRDLERLREHDAKVLRRYALLGNYDEAHITNDIDADYISQNLDLLPVLHHLYLVESASDRDIEMICDKNNIDGTNKQRIQRFLEASHVSFDPHTQRYFRKGARFRVPPTESGHKLKEGFLEQEIKRSCQMRLIPNIEFGAGTSAYSTIVAIPAERLEHIAIKISALIAEIVDSGSGEQLDNPNARAYFVSVITSRRDEYDCRDYSNSDRGADVRRIPSAI